MISPGLGVRPPPSNVASRRSGTVCRYRDSLYLSPTNVTTDMYLSVIYPKWQEGWLRKIKAPGVRLLGAGMSLQYCHAGRGKIAMLNGPNPRRQGRGHPGTLSPD